MSSQSFAWESKVVEILQHKDVVIVKFAPKPSSNNFGCQLDSYILEVDESPAIQQQYSLLLTALASGKTVVGYNQENDCAPAGHPFNQTSPRIDRIGIKAN